MKASRVTNQTEANQTHLPETNEGLPTCKEMGTNGVRSIIVDQKQEYNVPGQSAGEIWVQNGCKVSAMCKMRGKQVRKILCSCSGM